MKFYKKITENFKSNSLVVLVSEDTDSINFSNDSVNLLFSESLSNEDLSSLGKITVLHTPDSLYKNFYFLRIICIGVGSLEEIDSNKIRRAAGSFGRYFLDSKLSNLSFFVDSIKSKDTDLITESFFEGFFLGNYIFDKYKSQKFFQILNYILLFLSVYYLWVKLQEFEYNNINLIPNFAFLFCVFDFYTRLC